MQNLTFSPRNIARPTIRRAKATDPYTGQVIQRAGPTSPMARPSSLATTFLPPSDGTGQSSGGSMQVGMPDIRRNVRPLGSGFRLASTQYRAKGGPVKAGKAYVVGEKRAEVFVPKQDGTIVPNTKMISHGKLMQVGRKMRKGKKAMGKAKCMM
jgi:hypothetical protein